MNNDEEVIEKKTDNEQETTPEPKNEELDTDTVDDVSFEDVNDEGEVDVKATIKKLREKIKKLESEKQEYLDLSQRTRADYVNFKKEVESNRTSDRKFATKRFIEELLPVLDSYDMAQGNTAAWEAVDKNWRMGIEYIFGQLKKVLEGEGVTAFGKIGDRFDPTLHESIEIIPVEDEKHNDTIMVIMQSGYKMNDTVLRPARVKTGHYEKKED